MGMHLPGEKPEAMSLAGEPLYRSVMLAGADVDGLEQAVAQAQAAHVANPGSLDEVLSYIDALAAAAMYEQSIMLCTMALGHWPENDELLVRRGHRYLNIRAFDKARADLAGIPDEQNSSLYRWYHLGIAEWMTGRFDAAARAFEQALPLAADDSTKVALVDWLYMALSRTDREAEAQALLHDIHADMVMTGNNHNYLNRLLFYKGELSEQQLLDRCRPGTLDRGTVAFGLGVWLLQRDRIDEARQQFESAARVSQWAAFGVAAAEVELARLGSYDPQQPETYSLLGLPLYASVAVPADVRAEREEAVATTRAAAEGQPDNVAAIRDYAKSLAALHQFGKAKAVLSEAIERLSDDHAGAALLYCDRGHCCVNMRRFAAAIDDLQYAARLGADEFDVWYHLGLAYFMTDQLEPALEAFRRCLALDLDDSGIVAITDWLYVTLQRLERFAEADQLLEPIHAGMEMTQNNHLYLKQLLFYKGEITEQQMTELLEQGGLAVSNGFTMGCWHARRGRMAEARRYFERVVAEGTVWGAFGQIGCERELLRTHFFSTEEVVSR